MSNWIPGLRNQVLLDDVPIPVLPGSTFSMPRNLMIPQVFSGNNMFQYVNVEGLQFPTININTMIMKSWFNATVLGLWFERVNDDVQSAGVLKYWDGKRGVQAPNCKVSMLSIGGSLGDMARCRLVLVGAGAISFLSQKPSSDVISDTPAAFQHIVFGGGLSTAQNNSKACAGFDLTFSNNLDVCPELNNSVYPTEHNSGQLTGTMRLVRQAGADLLADGTAVTFTITPPGGSAVTITVHNPVCHDPQERTLQFPRQMREFNYALLGNGGPDQPIFSVA